MKKLLIIVALIASEKIIAQDVALKKKGDTLFVYRNSTSSIGRMPNALDGCNYGQVFIANNNRGFNQYQSNIDNMPVLQPDSANAASLKINNSINPSSNNISHKDSSIVHFPPININKLFKGKKLF